MSDVNVIVDVNSNNGNIVVQHVCESILDEYDIMRVISYYEVLVDGVLKHKSSEPEDIMRALGHYLVEDKA